MNGTGTADPKGEIGMEGDASADKRACAVDTEAMALFARSLFDRSWMERMADDLAVMNDCKVGHPFVFPDSVMIWGLTLRAALGISYRMARGIVNVFLEEMGHRAISLAQFYARCIELSMPCLDGIPTDNRILALGHCDVTPSETAVTVAVDSTGISLNKYGGWLAHRWNRKPVSGWVKLHAAVNVDTDQILAYAITDESCGDPTCMDLLMEQVLSSGHRVKKLLADSAYDTKAAWKKYSDMGIEVVINIKSSQLGKGKPERADRIKCTGYPQRRKHMVRILNVGRDQWKLEVGYGRRWKVECTFSDLKRLFGDILRARARWNDVAETFQKVRVLNIYKSCRQSVQAGD